METSIHPTQVEDPFPCPSGVNVADSVTLKLCPTNYLAWKQLMLTFLEFHKLSGFVDGTTNPPNKPAAEFLVQKPDAVRQPITWCSETALIVAVCSANRNHHFVKNLMDRMELESVALKDTSGATALHAAVDGGNIEAAEWLVQMNSDLANIGDKYGTLAVHVAAGLGNRDMVDFLLKHTTNLSDNESGLKLLHSLASSGLYGE
ncbi:hypothetical protein RHSIM_Rhsim05G0057800 [Rhododendron simsii]|uniref:Retrotransposon Copia-like N-terminal domain-containing protein n=1 Tax=Rhododendron simsii TaxID=118357 RepID=A0A834GWM8_RHOSS|nr:hypothetical protein RHSIM_Rhsim05G0057800 [Rhododendron simsii]